MADRLEPIRDAATGAVFQPVRVAASRPFAEELLAAWSALDGVDRRFLFRAVAFNVPVATYRQLLPAVRTRLRERFPQVSPTRFEDSHG